MGKTHWRTLYESSKYTGAYEFKPGDKVTVTIASLEVEEMMNPEGKKEKNPVLHFRENTIKPLVMNKTNARRIQKVAGSTSVEDWIGKKIVFEEVMERAFGEVQPVLRVNVNLSKEAQKKAAISNPAPICTDCGNRIEPFGDKPPEWVAQYTKEKFGAVLCIECGKKRSERGHAVSGQGKTDGAWQGDAAASDEVQDNDAKPDTEPSSAGPDNAALN